VDQDAEALGERDFRRLSMNKEEAFGEGQGPHRAVEPMMMMMMMYIDQTFITAPTVKTEVPRVTSFKTVNLSDFYNARSRCSGTDNIRYWKHLIRFK
jgi:hypothetical protein